MIYAASWAMRMLVEELLSTGTTACLLDRMIAFNEFNRPVDLDEIRSAEAKFYKDIMKSQTP